jgi:hypothetical protein
MKKKKKAAARELATIAAEIRETYRNDTGNVIKRGNLLLEAKAQVKHGEWLPWLDENFSMDERTAQRAMAAAKFAAKYDGVSYLNLSVEALYELSAGDYSAKVVKAVIKEAKTKPVSAQRVWDIEESFTPKLKTVEELEAQMTAEGEAEEQREAEGQAEAKKILDGPSPELAPVEPEKLDPDRFARERFTTLLLELKKLTKEPNRFAACAVSPEDLLTIADFLRAVRLYKLEPNNNDAEASVEHEQAEVAAT